MRFEDTVHQDEFTYLQTFLAIEQSFGFEFTDTEILDLETIEELITLIKSKNGKKPIKKPTKKPTKRNASKRKVNK